MFHHLNFCSLPLKIHHENQARIPPSPFFPGLNMLKKKSIWKKTIIWNVICFEKYWSTIWKLLASQKSYKVMYEVMKPCTWKILIPFDPPQALHVWFYLSSETVLFSSANCKFLLLSLGSIDLFEKIIEILIHQWFFWSCIQWWRWSTVAIKKGFL